MKNRNRMLLISAAVASASAFAAGPQLVFDTGDENSYVVNISGLSRVEFREGGLNVVGQEERFLPYSGLGRVTIDHAGTHTDICQTSGRNLICVPHHDRPGSRHNNTLRIRRRHGRRHDLLNRRQRRNVNTRIQRRGYSRRRSSDRNLHCEDIGRKLCEIH